MKSYKRELPLVVILFMMSIAVSSQTLVLHHADGSTTDIELYLQPRINFEADKVLITSTVLDMEYPKENVLRFTYKGKSTRINSPQANIKYSTENGRLVFHGIKSTDKVAVYTVNGVRIPVQLTRSAGNDIVLPLASIPSGVYLLSVNGKTCKFTKP